MWGIFVAWLQDKGINSPSDITAHQTRAYLVGLQRRGLKDATQHAHARGIKTWLRWLVNEGELAGSPKRRVSMPRLEKRMRPPFRPNEVKALVAACKTKAPKDLRDRATTLSLLDSGLRASELASLRVNSVDMRSLRLLMGHTSLAVLQRYLALAGEDIERAHKLHSPVDNLL
ncbi:MAG: tyrosine-type recombinase/integrase [Anaerolineae bacterium]|nr:tyrosine-type recombinase/integrase [Anaerolineae bacterium]NIN96347.1 tyrosine-type recombinase/integrase [Anaerolineae bacterium]NIQ79382.1 tyrosine-type recombinase/integrase [Anaerolineae bacterium]